MSVKMRLKRMGGTNRPFYRVVIMDGRRQRDGRAIQELGYYDPLKKPAASRLDEERVLHWLSQGAEPSETVRRLLHAAGILEKWHLLRRGVTSEEATRRVGERLVRRVTPEQKPRLSKKAKAKAQAAAADSGG